MPCGPPIASQGCGCYGVGGLSTAEIGRLLGVSKSAVAGKIDQLGLPPPSADAPAELSGRWLLLGRNMGQTGHIRDRLLLGPVRRWRNCRGITSLNTSRNSSSVRSAS